MGAANNSCIAPKVMNKNDSWDPNYKAPGNKKVRLTLFWLSNYTIDTWEQAIAKTKKLLAEHGLGLDVYPASRSAAHTITIPGDSTRLLVRDETTNQDDFNWMRLEAGRIFDDQKTGDKRQRLPVFFCEFKDPAHGLTVLRGKLSGWLPYCMVSGVLCGDKSTLVHEIGHAAGLNHLQNPKDLPKRNFMDYVTQERDLMYKAQVQVLEKAYFVI